MNRNKALVLITILTVLLGAFATTMGLFYEAKPAGNPGAKSTFESIYGESVTLYGHGLYAKDSVSVAAQEEGQDAVTLFLGIPLLVYSFSIWRRGTLKGKLLLSGMFGYFLYTYASMAFLTTYNRMFLVYVALFSLSLYGFVLSIMDINPNYLMASTGEKLPRKFIGSMLTLISILLLVMWSSRIVPSMDGSTPPIGLEHYTTLVIQVLDLGIIIPAMFLVAVLLIRKNVFGTLFASVFIIKAAMLITAIEAMSLRMIMVGAHVKMVEIGIFALFGILTYTCLFLLLKNIKEQEVNTDAISSFR